MARIPIRPTTIGQRVRWTASRPRWQQQSGIVLAVGKRTIKVRIDGTRKQRYLRIARLEGWR